LEESREMVNVIKETGVFFQMDFQRRFDRGYVAAKKKIEVYELKSIWRKY
jgi:predicted dehydrogenase